MKYKVGDLVEWDMYFSPTSRGPLMIIKVAGRGGMGEPRSYLVHSVKDGTRRWVTSGLIRPVKDGR